MSAVEENNWNEGQNQGSNQNQNENQNQGQRPDQNSNQNQNQHSKPNSGVGESTERFQITGNWGQQSSQLKEKYNQLTDSDLNFKPGQENQLMDQIGTRLNKSRDEVTNILNEINNPNQQNQNQQNPSNKNQPDQGKFNEDEPDRFTL